MKDEGKSQKSKGRRQGNEPRKEGYKVAELQSCKLQVQHGSRWFKVAPPGGVQGWPERVGAGRAQNTEKNQ